ncbi:MAG: protoglobin domain-containing protein [Betaproteobacteria bacterium]|nr:protoglobin domain-containing protein [Betaproteobacteria bacterium]
MKELSQEHAAQAVDAVAMGMEASEQAALKAFLGMEDEDASLLRELAPYIQSQADAVVAEFYGRIEQAPELTALIRNAGTTIERLKQTQRTYLLEIFAGDFGAAYIANRLRVGAAHQKAGLTPRWYLGSYALYLSLLAPRILRHWWWQPTKAMRAILALNKVLSLDAQLAIDTYIDDFTRDLRTMTIYRTDLEHRIGAYHDLVVRVAHGDLTARIRVEGDDDLARLGEEMNKMVASLANMTTKVTETSTSILVSIEEVRAAIGAQSSGASQQAASVSETTATLEEIKTTSQQNLEKATALKEMSERARTDGDTGLAAVETAVAAMHDIRTRMEGIAGHIQELNERLLQVGAITDSVSELAQQSKMLALNASIEAAKAGAAGRGFAVVADEVKDMADQSRQATDQVQRILEDIRQAANRASRAVDEGNEQAEAGAGLAEQAGSMLRSLHRAIHDTTLATQQIVAAVRQEASGIEQIRGAMDDINKVTHQFVSATQQTDHAADNLTAYASDLQNMVRRFKVENLHFDFELARSVHHSWIARLDGFLAGRHTLTDEEAVSHHDCALGRWYDGDGLQQYGHIPEMQRLEAPHRELHELIRACMAQRAAGQPIEEPEVLRRAHELSAEIVDLLYALEAKARSKNEGRRS